MELIGISIINIISIDSTNDKLISAHDVVIDLIITINVLRLLSDMNNNITNICISTNIIISIVSNSMHISNTDCIINKYITITTNPIIDRSVIHIIDNISINIINGNTYNNDIIIINLLISMVLVLLLTI